MVDEAKQKQEFEPTPYKHSNRQELDETNETETVETKDTEEATPKQTTSFLDSNKQTKQQEHDFKKRYDDLKSHYDKKVNEWKKKEKTLTTKPTYAAPNSTEDAFKIGKVVKEYNITWEEIEEEARMLNV